MDNNAHQQNNVDQMGDDEEDELQMEETLNRRLRRGEVEYLIKWKGYENPEYQTWERVSNLIRCGFVDEDVLQEFENVNFDLV